MTLVNINFTKNGIFSILRIIAKLKFILNYDQTKLKFNILSYILNQTVLNSSDCTIACYAKSSFRKKKLQPNKFPIRGTIFRGTGLLICEMPWRSF